MNSLFLQKISPKRCHQVPCATSIVNDNDASSFYGRDWSYRTQRWLHHCGCDSALPHLGNLDVDRSRSSPPISESGLCVQKNQHPLPSHCLNCLLGSVYYAVSISSGVHKEKKLQ